MKSKYYFELTKKSMEEGKPIIFGGVLHDWR